LKKHAHQIMSRKVISVRSDMSAGDAASVLMNDRTSCLPVANESGACLGIPASRNQTRWSLEQFAERMRAA